MVLQNARRTLRFIVASLLVGLVIIGGQDVEMPQMRQEERPVSAREMSRLRTWGVREGVDETTPLVASALVAEGTPSPVGADVDVREPDASQLVVGEVEVRVVDVPTTIEALIRALDWDDETALRIARCESGLRSDAISWDGTSYGVMQLYAPIWAGVFPEFWSRWDSAEWNIAVAYQIYVRAGYSWWPWACWR